MTITVTETPRLANGAERKVWQALVDQLEPERPRRPRPARHRPPQGPRGRLRRRHRGRRHRLPRGQGRRGLARRRGLVAEARRPRARDRTRPPGPRSLLRAARLRRERPALDAGPAALGPRRRPAQHRAARRLRPARVPALEGHRPHRPAEPRRQAARDPRPPGTRPPAADPRRHRPARNGAERQGITATRRRRPRARPTRMPPTRSPSTRPSSSTPSGCSTASRSAAARAAARPSSRWSRPAGWPSSGQRVALVCYSHGLASYLERIAATWPRRQQPAYVGEFHDLGKQWGAPAGPDESLRNDETVQFWEHDLPLQMAELAAQLDPGHRFDADRRRRGAGLRRRLVGPAAGRAEGPRRRAASTSSATRGSASSTGTAHRRCRWCR